MDGKHENPHDMVQSILKNALGECSGIFDIIFLRLLNGITLIRIVYYLIFYQRFIFKIRVFYWFRSIIST